VCQKDQRARLRPQPCWYRTVMEGSKRAPDPFRPGEIPEAEPFAKAGRPGAAVVIVLLIVAVAVVALIYAMLR
jgi:hypothetical protein